MIIDRTHGNSNVPMIIFNIDAPNDENWPIWIGEMVIKLPPRTPYDRTRVRRRSSDTPDDELPPQTRMAASCQEFPINEIKFFRVYLFLF